MNRAGYIFVLSVILTITFYGCAATYVDEGPDLSTGLPETGAAQSPINTTDMRQDNDFETKLVVAVLPLGLSDKAAKSYPHLLEKSVGLGIHNRVSEFLYNTGRFRLVEEKPEIIKDVLERQWMSSSGMVDQASAVELGKILGAAKVIYGEVYDFAQGGERIVGLSVKKDLRTRMGIQIRYVDITTLEYIPSSGVGHGNDVGEATDKAIATAVSGLMRRLP